MKKWQEWTFVLLLVALAAAGGWMSQQNRVNVADANIETNQG